MICCGNGNKAVGFVQKEVIVNIRESILCFFLERVFIIKEETKK